jgi:hypothetical protein
MAVTARELRALDVRRPFSRAQARAAGIRLREILGPQFHKVLYDSYVSATVPITSRLRAEAALVISAPGAYVSHHTAAELWGGVVPPCSEVHITVVGDAPRSRRQGVRAHSATAATMPTTIGGLRVSTPVQTFLELPAALILSSWSFSVTVWSNASTSLPRLWWRRLQGGLVMVQLGLAGQLDLCGRASTLQRRPVCACCSSWLDCQSPPST